MGAFIQSLRVSPYLLLILTTLFWSSNFVLGRAVRDAVPPIALAFWRWAVALLILLPVVWPRLTVQWPLLRRHWRVLTGLACLSVTNFNTFVYIGLQTTTATNALILISTAPVLIVALSFVVLGLTINRWQALGIALSLTGILVIVTRGELAALLALQFNRGDAWVFAAVLSWALYSVYLKWRPAGMDPLLFLAATIGIGVLLLTPVYLWDVASSGSRLVMNRVTVASVVYVAVFPSLLAYVFWNRAVAELGANRSGQFLHLMPAFGAVLAFLLLGERLYAFHWIGIALIALGIYLATVRRTPSA